ncbi:bifunctional UDP-N-acetylglucosamine diphosphorylase/glucosamine-1-phosphate N-acetyltransferase GlmU [Peptoniphilus harei]|uniref:bifunctional UDP-N-acetylglucosamine diphosphorylase/glucosamine-1-phosphate N-acetyltransferase GlmU n=1 Tax=Peptoniphilus harei TaxID=54005 RepID=UPI00254A691C|nr:bifunctional UDP-N-acetylglucosamine diphosphorylase/glucosamine-1-phosphate N-acetyltransferase GlmU [Peptoniphilus harei]MDK7355051.1 bifunctional UDP-N-acetylglucosamine diphosphorylase/glucosamine-1-phosphate N-acetyltransferase GlmU [Peptoniphilus harei]MDK7370547.1 bifunctional UDP-N-acetylglucosamine diphosphorylase/glucosamine-1-phosphate N-acetyltransferase GlmU [Peptoniphilus harei]
MKVSVILAAGEGTRMKSKKPKVLHEILGRPMLFYVLNSCKHSQVEKNLVVVGHNKEKVCKAFEDEQDVEFIEQPIGDNVPYGTGYAVMNALDKIEDDDTVIILNGDTPIISNSTISCFLRYHEERNNDITVLSADMKDPTNYGRIVRDENANVVAIVEEKDASEKQKLIREINSGIFAFKGSSLKSALQKINTDNAANELYITDTLEILVKEGKRVDSFKLRDTREILGVNSRYELSIAAEILQKKINKEYMINGVGIIDPKSTYIEYGATIERDVMIYPGTRIDRKSVIKEGAEIYSSTIKNSTIGEDVIIRSSEIEDSSIGRGTTVGPYAHLRPNSHVGENCKIGNFVEVKNSNVGDGSKMSHLAYIGDADVGSGVNIGCGVVFVNYDGRDKFRAKVGDNAFIGSNANLVAPIEVEDNGYVAAGSTITKKVLKGQLSLERAPQKNIDGWVERKGFMK